MNIGPYELLQTLGKGSFGKVKLARHNITNHKVAIKIIARQALQAKGQQKLRREVNFQQLLCHPHIVRLFEVIHTQQHMFLVMEYASGGELFECIANQGRLHENTARRLFQQLVCAVAYCHDRGVAHRDLKPENILLHNNDLKLADFGLSNTMKDGEFLRTSCGSPNYAAPEVISGALYSGTEADVWSCGVILYAMLVGRLPFDEDSLAVLFKRIKEGRYSIPSTVSASAADLISHILVVDVIERFTIRKVMAHPWFQEGLPRYLQIKPADLPLVDDATAKAVAEKFKRPLPEVMAMLTEVSRQQHSSNPDDAAGGTHTENETDTAGDRHALWVAYTVLLDIKRAYVAATELAASSVVQTTSSSSQQMVKVDSLTPPLQEQHDIAHSIQNSFAFTPLDNASFAATGGLAPAAGTAGFTVMSVAPASSVAPTVGWRLGVTAETTPAGVMDVVYDTLVVMEASWRALAPYHLAVRAASHPGCVIALQLFRPLKDGAPDHLAVVVDFSIVQGNVLLACDLIRVFHSSVCRRLEGLCSGVTHPALATSSTADT